MVGEIPNNFSSIMPINGEFQLRIHDRKAQSTEYGAVFPTYEAAQKTIDMKPGIPVKPAVKAA